MTQPPGGYPPPEPGGQTPPPADPFYAPPSWDPPGASTPPSGAGNPYDLAGQPPPQPGSPYQPPGSPYLSQSATVPMPAAGGSPAGPPGGGAPYGPPGGGQPYGRPAGSPPFGPPPRRRGLLIGLIVAAAVLVLGGGGGLTAWLLSRDPDRNGAASPTAAVEAFLQAVYHNQDAEQAADLVCSEARDEAALQTKIDELKAYQGTQLNPIFEWSEPTVVEERDRLAVVEVTVTMTTSDEKTANQNLAVSVLDKQDNGWWVCDLATVAPDASSAPGEEGDPAPSESPAESGE
ncbi:MAG TPA: hypothetical protein VIL37_16910 [Natronosporangium sp.]